MGTICPRSLKMHPVCRFTVLSYFLKLTTQMYTTFVYQQRKGNFLPFPNLEFDYHYQLPLTPSDCFITHHFFLAKYVPYYIKLTSLWYREFRKFYGSLKGLKYSKLQSKIWAIRSVFCHSITILVVKGCHLHKSGIPHWLQGKLLKITISQS